VSRRRDISLEAQLDYDLAAHEASEAVAAALHGPREGILADDDVYVEALTVLRALAAGGWLDPVRLSLVQIEDMLQDDKL